MVEKEREKIDELIKLLSKKRLPIEIAFLFKEPSLRKVLTKQIKNGKKSFAKVLIEALPVERKFERLRKMAEIIRPIPWVLGRELVDRIAKLLALHGYELVLLSEAFRKGNLNEVKQVIQKLKERERYLDEIFWKNFNSL